MKVTPLDLRQTQFTQAMRGFDKTEVRMFLADAADDYEAALREIDRLRNEVVRMEQALAEHRDREANLRNTLLTAQRLADQIRDQAEQEARATVREAEVQADLLLHKSHARLGEVRDEIRQLKDRRRQTESTLETSIGALEQALELIRAQDQQDQHVLDDAMLSTAPDGPVVDAASSLVKDHEPFAVETSVTSERVTPKVHPELSPLAPPSINLASIVDDEVDDEQMLAQLRHFTREDGSKDEPEDEPVGEPSPATYRKF